MLCRFFILFLILARFNTYSQLADFQLQLTGTNEVCLGNGTLQMTTTNTTAGATISYVTYKLPNVNTPIATTQNLSGLTSGTYRVIATQTLGTLFNTQQQDYTIQNQIVNLTFSITTTSVLNCNNTASIVVNTLTGTASNYQIVSGPQTFPLQTSNTFSGLTAGIYRVRVFDNCGQAFVRDHTLSLTIPALTISAEPPPNIVSSCNTIDVANTITAATGTTITYPIVVKHTVFPPNGGSEIVSFQNISTGGASSVTVNKTINLFQNQVFTYNVEVTDSCGRIFTSDDFEIDPNPKVVLNDLANKCGEKYLSIAVSNFLPPYTVEFEVAPASFNPVSFNAQYPGPFNAPAALYGSITNVVPFGNYKVKITDACGRSASTAVKSVLLDIVTPVAVAANNGCGSLFGRLNIAIPNLRAIVSATITSAPANYTPSIPHNITSQITSIGTLDLLNLPIGFYNFVLVDECGVTFNLDNVEVPAFILRGLEETQLVNCVPGSGSLKIISGNEKLTNIIMTAAPANYDVVLPLNLNSKIVNGELYLSNLPSGNYTFEGTDACGYNLTTSITVIGYNNNFGNKFIIKRNCGAFDLKITDASNGTNEQKYWLQKLNTASGIWQHPTTGAAYTEGAIPDASTAQLFSNNIDVLNLSIIGNFRLLKTFTSYNDGNVAPMLKTCLEFYGNFEFFDVLKIDGVFNTNCTGANGTSDVLLIVLGSPPFIFKINSRNGDTSFNIDNGNNNTFLNLSPGTYNFQVEDQCGGIQSGDYAVSTLPNLVSATVPPAMLQCQTGTEQFATFDLTTQNSIILGSQNSNDYAISFHLNAADANSGVNSISNPNFFINTVNPQTIYARVIHRFITGCSANVSFQIFVGQKPVVVLPAKVFICENETVELIANAGFDEYEWSNGATTRAITVSEPGDYSVIARNRYATLTCSSEPQTISVVQSGKAKLVEIITQDWSDNNNSLFISVTGFGLYEFSVDNINFQNTGVFNNLLSGIYTIYVRDINGCPTLEVETYFLNYPKFFTPNGDGFNELWQIQFSELEPNLIGRIYDRFGKFICETNSKTSGWDGTLNGNPLPADDYWFVVERQNGNIFKGHFTLKR